MFCLVVTASRGTSAFTAAVTSISPMLHRRLLEREVLGDRLARQDPQAGHPDRLVPDELAVRSIDPAGTLLMK